MGFGLGSAGKAQRAWVWWVAGPKEEEDRNLAKKSTPTLNGHNFVKTQRNRLIQKRKL